MTSRRERVLVTGGSGFIGANLVRALLSEEYDVHLVLRPEAQTWRLAEIQGQYTPHLADLRDLAALRQAVRACKPSLIFHLATHGAYPFQTERAAILATNLQGTANLLDALADHDYRAFVCAGSSSEYGRKDRAMLEWDVLEPRSDYAVGKAASSLLCLAEAHRGKPVVVVRVFSAYGPYEEPTRLVPYVMDCCRRGQRPRVTSGRQPRDFIYVDDVVSLLLKAAGDPELRGQILHAGSGRQAMVRDMIETILAVCGQGGLKAEYGTEPPRPDEPTCWVASIEHTTELTGWKPRYELTSGIESMWTWLRGRASLAA